jgi:hypothetical protein
MIGLVSIRRTFVIGLAVVAMASAASAQPMMGGGGGMPDLSAISGKPLPDRGMATGTVMVRVARQTPANAVAGIEVVAIVAGPGGESRKRTAKTNAEGRALFEGLPAGHRFNAEVTVDGEKLTTDPFEVPATGGVRTMLIAGLAAARAGTGEGAGAGGGEAAGAGGPTKKPFTLGLISGVVQRDAQLPAKTVVVTALDETGRPMAGKTIELGHVKAGGRVEVSTQVTGPDGEARFLAVGDSGPTTDGNAPAPDVGAAVVMEHGDLRLGTDGFGFPVGEGVRVQLRVPARTADPSVIVVGEGGRLILQLRDDGLSFIETLPLQNLSDKLFDPGVGGIEIPLPREFTGAEGAEGEHKIEVRKGIGVAVHGRIPPTRPQAADPGRKSPDEVTFGFLMPLSGSSRDFEQKFPNGFGEFTFITDQVAGLTIDSPQITGRQEREANGKKYWLMRGEPIPPGGTLRFTVRGLPAPDTTGRNLAGVLALALVASAVVFGRRPGAKGKGAGPSERDRLVQRREKLFAELVTLESGRGAGAGTDRAARTELVQKLEAVYRDLAALDERQAA